MKPKKLLSTALSAAFAGLLSLSGSLAFARNALIVGDNGTRDGQIADIALTLSADNDAQGFVMVFEWDGTRATGVDLDPADGQGGALADAELVQTRVENDFMILAVVMDIDGRDGEKIPAGQNTRVGAAKIRCDGPAEGTRATALRLVDGEHAMIEGGPNLSNLIIIGGRSIGAGQGLVLENGEIECEGEGPVEGGPTFACGGPLGEDGNPTEVKGPLGSTQQVIFYYRAPNQDIQGLSMSVAYSCDLTAVEEDSLDVGGGALEQVNAEFVFIDIDNLNPRVDKDSCGFTLGVLVDFASPFDGRTLPRTSSFKKLFTLDFLIEEDADCGRCYWIKFQDGEKGLGDVSVKNLVSVGFFSERPETRDCALCVEGGRAKFIRGDCNFQGLGGSPVDIADGAAMVGYFFLKQFDAPCDDACDANDDGRLDAGDVVFILNYLFVRGSPKPPSPGVSSAGTDPTSDSLGCEGAETEC